MEACVVIRNLNESYQYCHQVTRSRAGNFYYAMRLLRPDKRRAMFALYAFMRHSDDICDSPGPVEARARELEHWRVRLQQVLDGRDDEPGLFPALADTIQRYDIPPVCLMDLLDGQKMDLQTTRYERFDDLYAYCYRVASVVGLCCIHVWGFTGPDAARLAEWRGVAFQLTNILRDLKEDAGRGRIYLPQEDLRRFGCAGEDLRDGTVGPAFRDLMRFEVQRARQYYTQSAPLEEAIDPDGRPALAAMTAIYRTILERIEASGYDVFSRRVRLSRLEKVGLAARAWWRWRVKAWRD